MRLNASSRAHVGALMVFAGTLFTAPSAKADMMCSGPEELELVCLPLGEPSGRIAATPRAQVGGSGQGGGTAGDSASPEGHGGEDLTPLFNSSGELQVGDAGCRMQRPEAATSEGATCVIEVSDSDPNLPTELGVCEYRSVTGCQASRDDSSAGALKGLVTFGLVMLALFAGSRWQSG